MYGGLLCGSFQVDRSTDWTYNMRHHVTLVLVTVCILLGICCGASYQTANFIVTHPDAAFANDAVLAAEKYRKDLSLLWVGREFSDWHAPCPITITTGPLMKAGGQTTFVFNGGEVYGWKMSIQGTKERVMDAVLPHEITHMVLATHFRRPVPRWADEGAASVVECMAEQVKHRQVLVTVLSTKRGIAFSTMYGMYDYPPDFLPLYAQGYSLVYFLVAHGGHRTFVTYLERGLAGNNWQAATEQTYGYRSLGELQNVWLDWVKASQPFAPPRGQFRWAQQQPITINGEQFVVGSRWMSEGAD